MSINRQIIVTSASKAIDRAKLAGKLDLSDVTLYNLINYYIEYTDGVEEFKDNNKTLKNLLFNFKYSHLDTICTYKTTVGHTTDTGDNVITNTPPVITSISSDINGATIFIYSDLIFKSVYSDIDGDASDKVRFTNLNPTNVDVYYDGGLAPSTFEIDIVDTNKLSIVRTNPNIFGTEDILRFRISDGTDFSNESTVSISASAIDSSDGANQPATIGDNAIITTNRVTTTLTLTMFTSGLTPPYNDPEGDLIDAIRIDEISTANSGVFKLNAVDVITGQIITREDIDAGFFTHVGADVSTIETDAINFSARDEGSLIWVQ